MDFTTIIVEFSFRYRQPAVTPRTFTDGSDTSVQRLTVLSENPDCFFDCSSAPADWPMRRCLPMKAPKPPSGALWLHEIKHDGFRVIARKDGARVKLYSRPGNDLTDRFSLIVEALAGLRSRSCIIDGEAVACDERGIAAFDLIRYRRNDDCVFLYAFDLIELNGDDLRRDPLWCARQRSRRSWPRPAWASGTTSIWNSMTGRPRTRRISSHLTRAIERAYGTSLREGVRASKQK